MSTKAKGRFVNRPTIAGGKKYDKYFIYIPTAIVRDSQFPFKTGDVLDVKLDTKNKRLILKRESNTPSL